MLKKEKKKKKSVTKMQLVVHDALSDAVPRNKLYFGYRGRSSPQG
jgi:hypothetical protein